MKTQLVRSELLSRRVLDVVVSCSCKWSKAGKGRPVECGGGNGGCQDGLDIDVDLVLVVVEILDTKGV